MLFLILQQFNSFNVKLNLSKCKRFCESIQILGYKLDGLGLHLCPDKVEAIRNAPRPVDVSRLKSYLGLLNFYIKCSSELLSPLYRFTRKDIHWNWTSECKVAYEKANISYLINLYLSCLILNFL